MGSLHRLGTRPPKGNCQQSQPADTDNNVLWGSCQGVNTKKRPEIAKKLDKFIKNR